MLVTPRLAAAYSPSSPLFTRISGTVVIPAEFQDQTFVVKAMINGRGPFRLLVDTGSAVSLITPEVATAVAARSAPDNAPSQVAVNGLGDEVEIRSVLLDTLALGTATFEGVPAGVSPDFAMMSRTRGQRLDGLIGFSVFSDALLGLDFPQRKLVLGAHWPEGLPPVRSELALSLREEVPVVSARLQGQDLQFIVDSGATAGVVLSPEIAQSAAWKAEPRAGALVSVLGECSRQIIGRLKGEFHLGRIAVETPVASVLEGPPTLGIDLLKNFCVVFDQNRDRMWLCSEQAEAVPVHPVRSLGLCMLSDGDGWRVAATIPGSPAEGAGISPGDIVTRIEGQSARDWSRDKLEAWTDAHPKVALSISHDATTRDVELPAWQLVP